MRLANIYFGLLAFRVRVYNFVARVSIICLADIMLHVAIMMREYIIAILAIQIQSLRVRPSIILSLDPDGEPSCSNSCHCWDCNSCAIHHQFCSMEKVCLIFILLCQAFEQPSITLNFTG